MRIKIDDTWYELGVNASAIMVEFEGDDHTNIVAMPFGTTRYVEAEGFTDEQLARWANEGSLAQADKYYVLNE